MYTTNLFLLATSVFTLALAQSTSTGMAPGSITISAYSAHPPGYTPSSVNTAIFPAFSGPSTTYTVPMNYNSTITAMVTASTSPKNNYTMVSSTTSTLSSASSAVVVATSTAPIAPISTKNAGAFRRVAGTGLVLGVAGSVFAVLL
jgi:hypothetical protein